MAWYTGRAYDKAYDSQVGIRARWLLMALSKLDGRQMEVINEELFGLSPMAANEEDMLKGILLRDGN